MEGLVAASSLLRLKLFSESTRYAETMLISTSGTWTLYSLHCNTQPYSHFNIIQCVKWPLEHALDTF